MWGVWWCMVCVVCNVCVCEWYYDVASGMHVYVCMCGVLWDVQWCVPGVECGTRFVFVWYVWWSMVCEQCMCACMSLSVHVAGGRQVNRANSNRKYQNPWWLLVSQRTVSLPPVEYINDWDWVRMKMKELGLWERERSRDLITAHCKSDLEDKFFSWAKGREEATPRGRKRGQRIIG